MINIPYIKSALLRGVGASIFFLSIFMCPYSSYPMEIKSNEVIVSFKAGYRAPRIMAGFHEAGIRIKHRFPFLSKHLGGDVVLIRSSWLKASELKRILQSSPWVKSVALNHRLYPYETIPNDPYFDRQWAHLNTGQRVLGQTGTIGADIKSTEAWSLLEGNDTSPPVIAVIDTGIDYTHEDIADSIWINQLEYSGIPGFDDDGNGYVDDIYGVDIGDNDTDPMDFESHGTHVAGIIGAVWGNGIGVAGAVPHVKLVAVKGFNSDEGAMYTSDEIAAIDYVLALRERGENIVAINASYGCHDCYEQLEMEAIERACEAGIMFIVAAGNESVDNDLDPSYPASYDLDCIISVAATDNRDHLASFSDYGALSVDLAAPGDGIYSTDAYTGEYAYMDGTSMATAFVTGAVAFLWSLHRDEDYVALKKRILKGVDLVPALDGKVVTGGRLNLFKAATLPGPCNADLNSDNEVDEQDLRIFAQDFGQNSTEASHNRTDIDKDGSIDGSDLLKIIAEIGRMDCL